MGLDTLMARIKSFNRCISLFCSLSWNCCSLSSLLISVSFWCWDCMRFLSSLTQLWCFISSLGMMRLQPCSQVMGRLGLNSHSSRWATRASSLTSFWQPCTKLSHLMRSLASRLRRMRGAGSNWAAVMGVRSRGQVGCRLIHSFMHALQNACSHSGACVRGEVSVSKESSERERDDLIKQTVAAVVPLLSSSSDEDEEQQQQQQQRGDEDRTLGRTEGSDSLTVLKQITCTGSWRTPEQIAQMSSSSTGPWKRLTSKPMVCRRSSPSAQQCLCSLLSLSLALSLSLSYSLSFSLSSFPLALSLSISLPLLRLLSWTNYIPKSHFARVTMHHAIEWPPAILDRTKHARALIMTTHTHSLSLSLPCMV